MDWLSALLKSRKKPVARTAASTAAPSNRSGVYLTETVIFGRGDSSVYFVDTERGIRKMLVNDTGCFQNFPGVIKEDFWVREVSANALHPRVRYRTSFEKRENQWLLLWTIQPDGDYWRDAEGFGGENEDEVVLYTYVDMHGDYTGPFRIYAVGDRCYSLDRFAHAHGQRYQRTLQALRQGRMETDVDVLFPRLYGMELRMGFRSVGEYYTLPDKACGEAYWADPVLSGHLLAASKALLELDAPITQIVDYPGHRIVQACMTLFYSITGEPVFREVLDRFFDGEQDAYTAEKLSQ